MRADMRARLDHALGVRLNEHDRDYVSQRHRQLSVDTIGTGGLSERATYASIRYATIVRDAAT